MSNSNRGGDPQALHQDAAMRDAAMLRRLYLHYCSIGADDAAEALSSAVAALERLAGGLGHGEE